uniref:POC1 centriolar protein B n=1 Tax=Rhinolophus ferrumequinum TaxID=59479 RepID=A0A671FIE3_RHIFE
MYRQRFFYSLYRHTHWVRCAKDLSLLFPFPKVESYFHPEVRMHRFYYGGLTLMKLIVKMLLKEISKGYILIRHHIFLISTREHHILVKEKRRPLKLIQSLR